VKGIVVGLPDRTSCLALDELYERGMGREQLARMLAMPVSQVPPWRRGGALSETEQARLANLAAFLDALGAEGIDDPVAWLEMYVEGLPPGYRVQLYKYYREDRTEMLLDLAKGSRDIESVLDALEPDWRAKLYSPFDVQQGPDGCNVIVARSRV